MDWLASRHHRDLFGRLVHPTKAVCEDFGDFWTQKLGESTGEALKRWEVEGLIQRAGIDVALADLYTVKELQQFARERSLRVGGKEREIIARIVDADPSGALKLTQGRRYWITTLAGLKVYAEVFRLDVVEWESLEEVIYRCVRAGDFAGAHRAWADYDSSRTFPRFEWLGLDPRRFEHSAEGDQLRYLFEHAPLGSGFQAVWGHLRQEQSNGGDHMLQHAMYWRRSVMDAAQSSFVIGFRIETFDAPCRAKADFAGCYRLADVPPMPHPYCTSEYCNCMGWSILEEESPQSPWRSPPLDVGTFWAREGLPPPGGTLATETAALTWWDRLVRAIRTGFRS